MEDVNDMTMYGSASHSPFIGVIGAGYWGGNLIRNFSELGVLRAICDKDAHRLKELQSKYPDCTFYYRINELLDDPGIGAVVIATPAETHGSVVRSALNADKDVFVEKPLCLSTSEAQELVALAEKNERILMVGHLLWYHPAVLKLKEVVDNGELGRIQYIYSNRLNLGRIRREENILWSFAPHDISVILGLLGEQPVCVTAQGGNYLHDDIADVTVSLLTFPSGVKAHVFVSWLHPFKEQKLVVVGDRKMAVFDGADKNSNLLLYPHTIDWKEQLPIAKKAEAEPILVEAQEPLRLECEHFLDCVKTRKHPRTDGDESLKVLDVLERCQCALSSDSKACKNQNGKYYVHESAWIDEDVSIGDETRIWHAVHVSAGSKIGKACTVGQNVFVGPNVDIGNGVKIQNNVSVYEGVYLEDEVFCGPSVVFTNVINPRSAIPRMQELKKTFVRQGATLGANATILCGIDIGPYAFVGAGAVVTKDVPDYALVVGNPARVVGWMCACGIKLEFTDSRAVCLKCEKSYSMKDGSVKLENGGALEYPRRAVGSVEVSGLPLKF